MISASSISFLVSKIQSTNCDIGTHTSVVNNLLPGFTDTDRLSSLIQARAKTNNKSEEAIADAMKDQIPIGRFAKPEEIAKKISIGKLNKFKEENSLLSQPWVMEPKRKVEFCHP